MPTGTDWRETLPKDVRSDRETQTDTRLCQQMQTDIRPCQHTQTYILTKRCRQTWIRPCRQTGIRVGGEIICWWDVAIAYRISRLISRYGIGIGWTIGVGWKEVIGARGHHCCWCYRRGQVRVSCGEM